MTDTPADTIRRAATLMRERAAAASPGPWHIGNAIDPTKPCNLHTFPAVQPVADNVGWLDAEHIAGLHPAVALVAADQYDAIGAEMAYWNAHEDDYGRVLQTLVGPRPEWTAALAAARAYLGEATR